MPKAPAHAGKSGSPSKGEPVYLAVGLLRRPHGVRGDILMEVMTDFPERLKAGTKVFVGEKHSMASIRQVRSHNEGLLMSFEGVDTPESVGLMRNKMVYVRTADQPALPEGEYYHHQLIGIHVEDEDGNDLGVVKEILETGANDVYVVSSASGGEILLPVIKDVILDVDMTSRKMKVHLLPGLLDKDE